MVGFGTQFLDADLDRKLELYVANGHVDDLSRFKRPYRMPPQLFHLDENARFSEYPNDHLAAYFQQKWLGRAVARIDWNRDGREDLAVGHLDDSETLLTNTTESAGRYLSLRLVGIQSSRDAIGTTVRARIGTKTVTRQLTAGDGYQSSNERRLTFGAGQTAQIDELTVRWPTGREQRFRNVQIPADFTLREGSFLIPQTPTDRNTSIFPFSIRNTQTGSF
jgi:hypothetical protein